MKILVCGSRTCDDLELIREVMSDVDDCYCDHEITIITGGARGADTLAAAVAKELDMDVITVPADWKTHGKAAGPIRNRKMLDMKPDLVVAFWDGESSGTFHCIKEASRRGITVEIYSISRSNGGAD